jgi:Caudovirus prohead serine protease
MSLLDANQRITAGADVHPVRVAFTFSAPLEERFASVNAKESGVLPESLDAKQRTVDVVWYSGATVPRVNYDTGETYMLRLDMAGCKMERLNAGAPVFDCHMSGLDFRSIMADKPGTKAQVGVVLKAWGNGPAGNATLKFDGEDDAADELFSKIQSGTVRNLSFGCWINSMELEKEQDGKKSYVATDWEPFEISPVTVPADFNTTFLTAAQPATGAPRATSPIQETQMETTLQPGAGAPARVTEEQLAAARTEAVEQERQRRTSIQTLAGPMKHHGITDVFISNLIDTGASVEQAREKIFAELAANADQFQPVTGISVTRDGAATKFGCMQAALLLRADPNFGLAKKQKHDGSMTSEFVTGHGPEYHSQLLEQGRSYRGYTLLEMARESLELAGKNTRGWSRDQIADEALTYARAPRRVEEFAGGSESSSDFPSILANVANKTARQAYEAYPQTFKPFCRMTTAADFKPLNRVQLSDAPSLEQLNEAGEFRRANLKDTNQSYSLKTFGKIVALTRRTIINDDLQMFTRVPAVMGVSAARMESDVVWAVITGNQVMGEDSVALFNSAHSNNLTGGNSALILGVGGATPTGLTQARSKMRLQKAQNGTPLNLTPRFLVMPTSQESVGLQLIYPIQLAASATTGVVPEWVMSLVPIVEPRLDANSSTAWYLISDSAVIDTIEYCYLEGQQGIYIETRQGFDVDGIEIKVREDFAAAAIDFRGLQKNAGA